MLNLSSYSVRWNHCRGKSYKPGIQVLWITISHGSHILWEPSWIAVPTLRQVPIHCSYYNTMWQEHVVTRYAAIVGLVNSCNKNYSQAFPLGTMMCAGIEPVWDEAGNMHASTYTHMHTCKLRSVSYSYTAKVCNSGKSCHFRWNGDYTGYIYPIIRSCLYQMSSP